MFHCLSFASTEKYKSIAFPVFGTGTLQYPWKNVANVMVETIQKFGRMCKNTTLQEVNIVSHPDNLKSIEVRIL